MERWKFSLSFWNFSFIEMESNMHLCLSEKNSRLLFWYLCYPHSLCNWDYRYAACFELKLPQECGDFCFQKQGQTIKDILRSNGFLHYCILRKWLGASVVLWICSNVISKKLVSSLVLSILNISFFSFWPLRGKRKKKRKKLILLDLVPFYWLGGDFFSISFLWCWFLLWYVCAKIR